MLEILNVISIKIKIYLDTIFQDILGNQWIEWPGRFEHNYSAVPDKCPGLIAFEKKISIQDSLLEPTHLWEKFFSVQDILIKVLPIYQINTTKIFHPIYYDIKGFPTYLSYIEIYIGTKNGTMRGPSV